MPPKSQKSKPKALFVRALNVRAETFDGVQPLKSNELMEWPYVTPTAEFMSKSGFYFTPTKKLIDRVTCFYCNGKQTKWEGVTDPTAHHLRTHPNCLFSKLEQYRAQYANDPEFQWDNADVFNDPFSEEAIEFRTSSYATNWPFDRIEDAVPTSEKMIAAGFSYCPQEENDDLAVCYYCNVSLEGWEKTDDPLFEHQRRATTKCYFLNKLNLINNANVPLKRSSDAQLASEEEKRQKVEDVAGSSDHVADESSVIVTRSPRKLRKANTKYYKIFSDDEDQEQEPEKEEEGNSSVEYSTNDDGSFGLTANSEELASEEEKYIPKRSSKASSQILGDKSKSKSKSKSSQSTKEAIKLSPKKAILDSSFDSNGMFSNKNIENIDLDTLLSPPKKSQPPSSKNSQKTITRAHSTKDTLQDITNVSFHKDSKPKHTKFNEEQQQQNELVITEKHGSLETKEISYNNEDDNDEVSDSDGDSVILVSQSKENSRISTAKSHQTSNDQIPENEVEDDVESRSIKTHSVQEKERSVLNPVSPASADTADKPIKSIEPSSPDSIRQSKNADSSEKSLVDSRITSKIILSQSRFQSSEVQRSRSPFLDDTYKGSDNLEKDEFLDPDDIPIEESTDHNIQLPIKTILPSPIAAPERLPHKLQQPTLKSIPALSSNSRPLQETDISSDQSFHSVDDLTPSKSHSYSNDQSWIPTDTNKLFEKFEDLETAKNYLSELKDLPYELNDDIDGRVSYFINEMPNEELNMTIEEWIMHTAKQGRLHLEMICQGMIEQFDNESDRALQRLQKLATE